MAGIFIRPKRWRIWVLNTSRLGAVSSARRAFCIRFFEGSDRQLQPFFKVHFRFPFQNSFGFGYVGAAALRVVPRKRFENELRRVWKIRPYALGKFENRNFGGIADVDG